MSPSVVNEVRLGYAWHELPRWGPRRGLAEVQALGIWGLTSNADLEVAPEFQITDFTTITQIAYNTPAHLVYDIHDNVTFNTLEYAVAALSLPLPIHAALKPQIEFRLEAK